MTMTDWRRCFIKQLLFFIFLSEWLLLPSVFVFKRNIDGALSENYFDRLQGVQDIETSCENYKKCNKFSNKDRYSNKIVNISNKNI